MEHDINLLVTTAGGSGVYPTMEAVKHSKYKINLTLVDGSELAGALYEGFKSYKIPFVNDSNYLCALKKIIEKENINYILTPLDEELNFLSSKTNELKKLNLKYLIPKHTSLLNAWDKRATFKLCKEFMSTSYILDKDLPLKKIYDEIGNVLLKPALSRGGRGIIIPEDYEEFEFYTKRFLKKQIPYLIQKLVQGKEYNITTLHDTNGNLVYAVPRWKFETRVIKSGSKASVIEENNEVVEFALKVLKKMDLEYGFNNVEVIQNEEGIFLLEVNAGRIAAQDMNIVKAGINYVDLFIDIVNGQKVPLCKPSSHMCNIKTSRDIWVDYNQIEIKRKVYDEIIDSCRTSR